MKSTLLAALFGAALVVAPVSHAQDFPAKPMKIVIGFAAGGFSDIEARGIAQHLEKAWGKPVVPENRPGASGMIAAEAVARAEPDGHTLLLLGASVAFYKILNKTMTFDPFKDLAPITMTTDVASVLVTNPKVPAKDLKEFVAHAKANPGKLNYGATGRGSVMMPIEALKMLGSFQMQEVAYRGEADYLPAVMGDQVQFALASARSAQPLAADGRLTVLASLGKNRAPQFPNIPSSEEQGFPGIGTIGWYGVHAPGGTPKAVLDKISKEIHIYLASPEYQERAKNAGAVVRPSTPDDFRAHISREAEFWQKVAKAAGVEPQ
jgi:tripartite-type tricarboxylate transporter receptor subunit TctC